VGLDFQPWRDFTEKDPEELALDPVPQGILSFLENCFIL
jgi:hypothetical protein